MARGKKICVSHYTPPLRLHLGDLEGGRGVVAGAVIEGRTARRQYARGNFILLASSYFPSF